MKRGEIMATSLILKFGTLSGEKKWTFNNADPEITTQTVNILMVVMIANGSIYQTPPLSKISAIRRTVEEDNYQITTTQNNG